MHRRRLARNAVGLLASFAAVAGCAASNTGISARPAYSWVGCSETERDAVNGGTTLVRICADVNARHYLGSNSGAGVVVAAMENLGTVNEARWELLPGRQYLILITPGGSGPGGQFRIVGPGNSSNPNRVGNYYQCLPLHAKPDSSFAKFGDCHQWVASTGAHPTLASSGDVAARASMGTRDGPAWVTCETGCCTTDAPQLTNLDPTPPRTGERERAVALAPTRRMR